MGVIINSVANSNVSPVNMHMSTDFAMKSKVASANINYGSKICPVVSEFRNAFGGMA